MLATGVSPLCFARFSFLLSSSAIPTPAPQDAVSFPGHEGYSHDETYPKYILTGLNEAVVVAVHSRADVLGWINKISIEVFRQCGAI